MLEIHEPRSWLAGGCREGFQSTYLDCTVLVLYYMVLYCIVVTTKGNRDFPRAKSDGAWLGCFKPVVAAP
jgi:hypothetical protein